MRLKLDFQINENLEKKLGIFTDTGTNASNFLQAKYNVRIKTKKRKSNQARKSRVFQL